MISNELAEAMYKAALNLLRKKVDDGYATTGVRQLFFSVGNKSYTAIEQNPNARPGSLGLRLRAMGHEIAQIRDNDQGILLGNFDLTELRFNAYQQAPQPKTVEQLDANMSPEELAAMKNIKIVGSAPTPTVAPQAAPPKKTPTPVAPPQEASEGEQQSA